MGLQFNGSQGLGATVSYTQAQPVTILAWVRVPDQYIPDWNIVGSIGDSSQFPMYNGIAFENTTTRAISFSPFASASSGGAYVLRDNTVHLFAGTFGAGGMTMYVDDQTPVNSAWSGGSASYDRVGIGFRNDSTPGEYFEGTMEHFCIFDRELSAAEISQLYTQTVAPDSFPELVCWLPLKSDLSDTVGTLSWTPTNFASPTYSDLGIEFAASEYTMAYSATADSGTVPVDGLSPYAAGSTVTVADNTGSLTRANFTFNGWTDGTNHYDPGDTFVIGSNTILTAEWVAQYQYRTINHLNYDPDNYSNAEIAQAANQRIYYEHASTGQDIIGDSDIDSSTGEASTATEACGLAQLYATNNRYVMSRDSHSNGNNETWFSSNTGLQTNHRGNPTPASKVSGFVTRAGAMAGSIDIAMFKYCWIDVWPTTSGYYTDGLAAANADIASIESLETANPGLTVVYWTMPLQSNESYQAREDYNDRIREYCLETGHWLIDIADIECHNDSSIKQTDNDGREIAELTYMKTDGGHLDTAGSEKMARAFWSTITAIANEGITASYEITSPVRKGGELVGAGVIVSLFKHNGSGLCEYVSTSVTDANGEVTLTALDGDSTYFLYSFDSSDDSADASAPIVQPILVVS